MHKSIVCAAFVVIASYFGANSSFAQYVGPTAGQKVAFMGDSITQQGEAPTGYVSLIAMALETNGNKIVVIPAGVSGNTSKDMLARLDKDVLSKKPDWMTLSCGVNDVWHGVNGVELEPYKQNITSIVDQATAAGIKVIILTATMISEEQAAPNNQKLMAYNDFLRDLAAKRHFPLADLNADMQAALVQQKAMVPNFKGNLLTKDGVHPNGIGHEMMAAGVLKALGLTDAQLADARKSWSALPNGQTLILGASMTVDQYLKLRTAAASQGHSAEDMLNADLAKDVQNEINSADSAPAAKP
jgi:lysophospholipase L1-like esterase